MGRREGQSAWGKAHGAEGTSRIPLSSNGTQMVGVTLIVTYYVGAVEHYDPRAIRIEGKGS